MDTHIVNSERVAALSKRIAAELGMSTDEQETVVLLIPDGWDV